jgi:hypothetical protein
MRTLYLRNVPDDVVARLERLAEVAGMSLSAVSVRELTLASQRARNPGLLSELPDTEIGVVDIVGAIDEARAQR